MSRRPAITSLLRGQAGEDRIGFDQDDLQVALRALERAGARRAAEAAADHDDAAGRLRAQDRGRANVAVAAVMPSTAVRRVIGRVVMRIIQANAAAAIMAAAACLTRS